MTFNRLCWYSLAFGIALFSLGSVQRIAGLPITRSRASMRRAWSGCRVPYAATAYVGKLWLRNRLPSACRLVNICRKQ